METSAQIPDESRFQALVVNIRRDLHPDSKPFSTFIIAEIGRLAHGWFETALQSIGNEASFQTAVQEARFYFEAIRYVERRMKIINEEKPK